MRSTALVIRAAILSAAVAGCCGPAQQIGSEVVPIHRAKLDALRERVAQDARSRAEPPTREEQDLAVCRMVCKESEGSPHPRASIGACRIHPMRLSGGPSRRASSGPDAGAVAPPPGTAAVATDPPAGDTAQDAGAASSSSSTPPEPEPDFAAVCELWSYPICGRRPGDWQPPSRPCEASATAAHLALSARLEADAVQAFEDLAADLTRLCAPANLVRRAKRAAEDERRHARAMSRAARRRGAHIPHPTRAASHPPLDLEAFATLNAVEGCTLETFGAALAHRSARAASSPGLRRLFQRIAGEETAHAQLSWAIHRWALSRLDPPTRTRVEAHRRAALARLVASPPVAPPGARESLGLPDEETARAMTASLAAGLGAAEMPG